MVSRSQGGKCILGIPTGFRYPIHTLNLRTLEYLLTGAHDSDATSGSMSSELRRPVVQRLRLWVYAPGATRVAYVVSTDKKGPKNMGTVKAVCTSDIKGIQKTGTDSVTLEEDFGITGDAHAGKWHRQVSLLGYESIEDFKEKGAQVNDGSFGENIIVEGFDLKTLPIGTRFACNEVILELTQIGKECHAHCAIYHEMGDCIMPREGVFTKVVRGGTIAVGDTIDIVG